MDTRGIEQMLSAMRSTATQAAGSAVATPTAGDSGSTGGVEFSQVLKNSIDQVNQLKQQADKMAEGFVAGESNQNLHEVMIALQTASISFQEMVQVRNKLVSAYQDIMNMQV